MEQQDTAEGHAAPGPPGILKLTFGKDTTFQTELRRRVDEFFRVTGRPKRGGWRMYLKTAIIFAFFVASYVLLVFVARNLWQGLLLGLVLGLATAGIGFNVQHDGGHQAYSERRWVNRMMAMTLDLIGSSSYLWRWKHSIIHHMYVNVTGYDNDIDLGVLARMTPHQKRRWFHRWQQFYMWPLYGFEAIKLQFVDDFKYIIRGRIGQHHIPRPTGMELVIFIVGKALFLTWAFVIPMLLHSLWVVLFYYVVAVLVLGMVLSLIFQMPHCVDQAEFPLPKEGEATIENPWAVHQAVVTVDFGRRDPILTWVLGGLNFHKEHHLFPLICHVNYPAMAKIVEQTCHEFGVSYREHDTFRAGLVSHYRWLRRMGTAD